MVLSRNFDKFVDVNVNIPNGKQICCLLIKFRYGYFSIQTSSFIYVLLIMDNNIDFSTHLGMKSVVFSTSNTKNTRKLNIL